MEKLDSFSFVPCYRSAQNGNRQLINRAVNLVLPQSVREFVCLRNALFEPSIDQVRHLKF